MKVCVDETIFLKILQSIKDGKKVSSSYHFTSCDPSADLSPHPSAFPIFDLKTIQLHSFVCLTVSVAHAS